ncbi:hypothetical protein KSS87_003168 [Heliosperma pusillum]|nr:hypothetical protein KSS87_003168 [Heliosperma pusillum]
MSSHSIPNTDEPSKPLVFVNVHSIVKLDGANYPQWRLQFESLLLGYGLFSHIDGSAPPSKLLTEKDKEPASNPAYNTWFRQDKLLFSAVASTLSAPVSPLLTRLTTTHEAWTALAAAYALPSRGHIKQLKHKLKHTSKGSSSVSDYMTKIKTIVDELALLGTAISQEDVTDQILDGLDSTYQSDSKSGAVLFSGPAQDGVYYWPVSSPQVQTVALQNADLHHRFGRMLLKLTDVNSATKSQKIIIEEEKVMIIGRIIGSRPPRCQGRCYSCGGHCVAVQVPTVSVSNLEYARGESSDYKPITWKCKCGSFLFDP